MRQKYWNQLKRIEDDAVDGVREIMAKRISVGDTDTAKVLQRWESEIASSVVEHVRRHYTIRNRVRK